MDETALRRKTTTALSNERVESGGALLEDCADATTVVIAAVVAVFLILLAARLTWLNTGSQPLVLAFGAMLSSVIFFACQAFFEFRAVPATTTNMTVAYTFDRKNKLIAQYFYNMSRSHEDRLTFETGAGAVLSAFPSGETDLTLRARQLTIASYVAYLFSLQFDWKMITRDYPSAIGNINNFQPIDNGVYSSEISRLDSAVDALRVSGNPFHKSFSGNGLFAVHNQIKLPSGCAILINKYSVNIIGPIISIRFSVDPEAKLFGATRPYSNPVAHETFEDRPRYMTPTLAMNIRVTTNRFRRHNPKVEELRAWAARVADGAKEWFDPALPKKPDIGPGTPFRE